MKKITCVCMLMILLLTSYGQEIVKDTLVQKQYKNAVFVELLGANGYLSINYERSLFEQNKLGLKFGAGVGYFYSNYTPRIFSITLRMDMDYQIVKNIKPTIGIAISKVLETNEDGSETVDYFVPAPNIGIDFTLLKRFHIVPKYYLLISKGSNYERWDMINWGGLQLKYDF